ncbi:hypothetical protein G7046_g1246 [Stylonectria norvegica]|nr:hypothetical protein G7046_g1246 [Stylonectria norvegica]
MVEHDEDPPQQVTFLPINRASSPPQGKHRRAFLSCERCRKRKSRCEPLHHDQPQPCKRCAAENQTCEFRSFRSTKRKASTQGEWPEAEHRASKPSDHQNESGWEPQAHSSPQLGHSPIADLSTAQSIHSRDNERSEASGTLDARARLVSTHLHNTSDALDLLTFAAAGSQGPNNRSTASFEDSQLPGTRGSPTDTTDASDPSGNVRKANIWATFFLIKKGVVSQQEVIEYLDFSFDKLWPLKPVVPTYYRNQARYPLLAAEEPLLLICLVTLASRYHPLSGTHGEIRSERIHWQTWKFLQRFLQSVMWGSTTTRSLGAIASMLLLVDWHPKAINNTMDFTEGDGELINFEDSTTSFKAPSSDATSLTGQRRYGMTSLMEKLNIVSPAYRSNKMSWILLSNSIALAHEGCCFEYEAHNPANAPSEAECIKQEWSRLVCVFIYLTDEGLAMRLGLEPLLPEKSRQVVRDRFSTTFADSLLDSTLWEGYFELLIEGRKGREFLHSLRKTEACLSTFNLVPDLEHLSRALGRWKRQYHHRHKYHYIIMYSFAPAAQALQSSTSISNSETLSRFAEQAAQASYDLLAIVVDVLQPSMLLSYLPVRCWLFIVAASLHLLKATLSKDQHVSEGNANIQLLGSAIKAIHDGSPDDSHMAIRFSKFLGIVLQGSLQTSSGTATTIGSTGSSREGLELYARYESGSIPFASLLEDVGVLDIPLNFDFVSDPLTWWDTSLGRSGFARFP